MWVRGLKQFWKCCFIFGKSRTLCGCVDWNWTDCFVCYSDLVAPYVGAWIETDIRRLVFGQNLVAPYVGAWIETHFKGASCGSPKVAPYVGAWIETLLLIPRKESLKSHPMWVRGLKLTLNIASVTTLCRTLCGCVDWNLLGASTPILSPSRTLCGCVDWNLQ